MEFIESGLVFVAFFVLFLVGGGGWFLIFDNASAGDRWPAVLGRTMFGTGLFFFFFCLIFIIAYGAGNGETLYNDKGELQRSAMRGNFTLGLFVALKDVGAAVGVALGFLSLAWGRFFDLTTMAGAKGTSDDVAKKIDEIHVKLTQGFTIK